MSKAGTLIKLIRADHTRFLELNGKQGGSVWRAFLHPRVAPVAWFRVAHALRQRRLEPLGALICQLNQLIFKVEIPARADVGPGLVLPHPMGIVVGSAKIGSNVTIFQNVTLGARQFDGAYDLTTRPTINDGVTIGAGAAVLGPITVGAGATIGANSLVIADVPAGGRALGVPASCSVPPS